MFKRMSVLVAVAAAVLMATAGSASACCPGDTSGTDDVTVTRAVQTGLHSPAATDVGQVADDSSEIACGTDCTGSYGWSCSGGICDTPNVTLTASDLNGWHISSWDGCDDASTGTCSLDLGKNDRAVTAYFTDIQNPTVGLNSPPTAGTHVRTTVPLSATASDNDAVASLTWWYQPSGGAKVTATPGSLTSHTFDTSGLAEGTYTFGVDAKDYANRVSSATVSLVVDHHVSAPVLGGTPDGSWTNTPSATISWSGLDSDVTGVQCKVGSGSYGACSSPWSPTLSSGANLLTVQVTDGSGNQNTAARTINYDGTAPTVGVSGSTLTNAPSFALALDGTGSSPTATCWVDAAPAHDSCSGTYAPAGLTDGDHTLHVHVVDQAGNVADATKAFTVDTTAPALEPTGGTPTGTLPPPPVGLPLKAIAASFSRHWSVRGRKTSTRMLKLSKLPAGARVLVRCTGKGRPFASRTVMANGSGVADLHKLFKKALRSGITVTITITKPGYAGEVFRFKTRNALPKPTTIHLAA